jgi:glutaredoxin-like YruB-family protein
MSRIIHINSWEELQEQAGALDTAYLLLYKSGSDQSDCALKNLAGSVEEKRGLPVFSADVNVVRDIHVRYNIDSVPVLLELEKGESRNIIKGCHKEGFLNAFFENALYRIGAHKDGKTVKRVTVYSTPGCSWCNTLKSYLRKNNIRYREVDVSRDQRAAEKMVRRSGQQGVPQTDINGQIIVGFDQGRIDQLLEIK